MGSHDLIQVNAVFDQAGVAAVRQNDDLRSRKNPGQPINFIDRRSKSDQAVLGNQQQAG